MTEPELTRLLAAADFVEWLADHGYVVAAMDGDQWGDRIRTETDLLCPGAAQYGDGRCGSRGAGRLDFEEELDLEAELEETP